MTTLWGGSYSKAILAGTVDVAVGAAGGTPSLTYAADATRTHLLGGVVYSYSGTAVAGSVAVVEGTTGAQVVAQWDVRAAGPGQMTFDPPLAVMPGSALTVFGYPGGTANTVKLSARHWVESV